MDTEPNRRYEDIESVTRSHRRSFLGTSPAAALLPAVVCLLMVLSSFVVSSSHSQPDSPVEGAAASPDISTQRSWDWDSFASPEGLVDVIVMLPGCDRPDSVVSMLAEARLGRDSLSLNAFAPAFIYSKAMNGFAATMTLEEIAGLASMAPGAVVYPDLPVNASLSRSVKKVGADTVWNRTDSSGLSVTGEGIVVAVIDTGIDYTHPDLGGGIGPTYKVLGGYDFVNQDSDPMDDNGHGTHVAGIIAADGDVLGVAPSAKLLAYKVLGSDGSGSMSTVISAIDLALDPDGDGDREDSADIISMSLGGAGDPDDPVCQAVEEAISLGVVVVVAAGNEGPSLGTVASPGMACGAVTVGAVDEYGMVASFSSRGPVGDLVMKPEITAPGVQIVSTVPFSGTRYSSPTGYMSMSGTSMATPHVSGAAALMLQMHPGWTPEMVKSALISGSVDMGDSYWVGGAGEIWIPQSIDATLFSTTPFVSYGLAGGDSATVTVSSPAAGVTAYSDSDDWYSLSAGGVQATVVSTSLSYVSPSSLSIAYGGSASMTLTVSGEVASVPEGYYSGEVILTWGSSSHRIPFGFVVLCKLDIHVMNDSGQEVSDPYGGVFLYSLPDAAVALSKRGYILPAPPASFLVPSGTYAVHAMGHQMTYVYSDPYVLSATVSLERMASSEVYLRMADAREMTVDLETEGGQPIFVKDFRLYVRHEGTRNVSFDITGSDYSIVGSELFSVRDSMVVHVSDTDAQVGISVSGFSYTPAMWSFMELNWDHWFEYVSGTSTSFMFEASADLQYLLAWEFDGVSSASPSSLSWDDGTSTYYQTKYDIPGTIMNPWCNWGQHRSMGGDAAFFVRRDTDTSLNSFFSGITRTTIVHGTFSELYYPRGLFEGFVERQYYSPDYDHMVRASTTSEVYLPDRNFLTSLGAGIVTETVGAGPYYPSVYMENTDSAFALFHPLLRDDSGARVGGKSGPSMNLYRNGGLIGMYQLSEYLARPDAVRHVDLSGSGSYVASIRYYPSSQVYNDVTIELGFVVPSSDLDPPRMTGLELAQRFVPGQEIPLSLTAYDTSSAVMASVSWRPSGSTTWTALSVEQQSGVFSTAIPTTASTTGVDILIELVDTSGNFLRYTAKSASLAQVPVVFELTVQDDRVTYSSAPDQVVLTGRLTDVSGNPLSSMAAVPLELFVDGEKVGMVLDEYMTSTSHTHDGNIRFDWTIDPSVLFTGPNQTAEVRVSFDLGVYEPVEVSFQLRSVYSSSIPPQVSLVSPANGAVIAAGVPITLSVLDDGTVVLEYSLDGGAFEQLASPYEIDTGGWSDGEHVLDVEVTDDDLNTATATYMFDIDATDPSVSPSVPVDGGLVPTGYVLWFEVYDRHLSTVTVSIDGGGAMGFPSPYALDLSPLALGVHTVAVNAIDSVGHSSSVTVSFEIIDSTLVLSVLDPANGAFITSGTPISLYVLSSGTATCRWTEGAAQHSMAPPYVIDTESWGEGQHTIVINATDNLGSWAELLFSVTVDDTLPVIEYVSPSPGSYLTPGDSITIRATDANFDRLVWSLSGFVGESTQPDVTISMSYFMIEGGFTLQVSVYDKADNVAEESIMYTMDISAPVISVSGTTPEGAIAPAGTIEVTVDDPLLSQVSFSVDSLEAASASSSFTVDMSGLALGEHVLHVSASDRGGREASMSFQFYVDGTPPEVEMTSGEAYAEGVDFEVTAIANDDFGLGEVVCRYETTDGAFVDLTMLSAGDGFVASIPASSLWDGMTIQIIAEDTVGNSATSSAATLAPGSQDDGVFGGLPGSLASLALIFVAASLAVVAFAMIGRRRGRRAEAAPYHQFPGPYGGPGRVEGPGDAYAPGAQTHASLYPEPVPLSARGPAQMQPCIQPPQVDRISILEATTLLSVASEPVQEDAGVPSEEDYLEQLEQVLNLSLVSKPTEVRDWDQLHLGRSSESSPLKVSGLTLKRLMEKDR